MKKGLILGLLAAGAAAAAAVIYKSSKNKSCGCDAIDADCDDCCCGCETITARTVTTTTSTIFRRTRLRTWALYPTRALVLRKKFLIKLKTLWSRTRFDLQRYKKDLQAFFCKSFFMSVYAYLFLLEFLQSYSVASIISL